MRALSRRLTDEQVELERRRLELSALRAVLVRREAALDDLRAQLLSFEGRYIRQVGKLYKQLDDWEKKITVLDSPLLAAEPERECFDDPSHAHAVPEPAVADDADPLLQPDLKALFRELARRIHPDFARDATDSRHRTRLMAQANEAFRRKDALMLRRMLNGHDGAFEQEQTSVLLARLVVQLTRVDGDIRRVEAETEALQRSELAALQRRAIAAAQGGRDLLAEMAARVKGNIGMAMRRYELDLERRKRGQAAFDPTQLLTAEGSMTRVR